MLLKLTIYAQYVTSYLFFSKPVIGVTTEIEPFHYLTITLYLYNILVYALYCYKNLELVAAYLCKLMQLYPTEKIYESVTPMTASNTNDKHKDSIITERTDRILNTVNSIKGLKTTQYHYILQAFSSVSLF